MTMVGALRSGLRIDWVSVDGLVAGAIAVDVVATGMTRHRVGLPAVLGGLVVAGAVAVRRRRPVMAAVAVLTGAGVAAQSGGTGFHSMQVALVLSCYSLGRRSAAKGWSWFDALVLSVPLPVIALSPGTSSPGNPLIVDVLSVWLFFVVMPFVAGRVVGVRAGLTAALRANAVRLEEEQRRRELHAAIDERTRIARELHDVVAHSVSVMVIQTGAARAVVGRDRAAAIGALRAVEACGRDALLDVRRMIGVLRRDEVGLTGDVAAGFAQLNRLADRARAAGLPVQVRVDGKPRALPSALDLMTYRVVQEALTNALKHAGRARARVVVTFTPDVLVLDIVDTGEGGTPDSTELGGQGLIGMRERVELHGGRLQTGFGPAGGFQVHARIPLTHAVTA